jgi:hypothetical protein
MSSSEKPTPKKLYEPPVLSIYGKVEDLTQKVGIGGHPDGGRGIRAHTSLR